MKCINTHRNWAKLQLMPQSFFLMFSLQRYADGVELHQLHQSQSWKSAKSAVTGAVIFRRCKRNVEALFHTCFTSWLPYLSIRHQIWQRLAGHVCSPFVQSRSFPVLRDEDNNSRSARQQTGQHQYFTAFQSQTSYLIACQSVLITWWSNSGLLFQQKVVIHSVVC